jgi:uncharacterized protein (TIGR03435 family)
MSRHAYNEAEATMKRATILAGCIIAASPIAWNQPAKPAFEVASIKLHEFPPGMTGLQIGGPGPLRITGNRVTTFGTLGMLVMAAYDLRLHQISGGPEWTDHEGNPLVFDIQAKAEGGPVATDQARRMLQTLLADRFQLQVHQESKAISVYELTVDRNGPKLKSTQPGSESKAASTLSRGVWTFNYTNLSMSDLVTRIASNFDQPLLDKTGLKGGYDFTLEYKRANPNPPPNLGAATAPPGNADSAPTIFIALQRVGLKIVHAKAPVEITVIDHAERPSEN